MLCFWLSSYAPTKPNYFILSILLSLLLTKFIKIYLKLYIADFVEHALAMWFYIKWFSFKVLNYKRTKSYIRTQTKQNVSVETWNDHVRGVVSILHPKCSGQHERHWTSKE